MQYHTMLEIEKTLKKYNTEYRIGNDVDTLNVFVSVDLNDEDKEFFLNDLDLILPYGLIFSHEYENGNLKVVFEQYI